MKPTEPTEEQWLSLYKKSYNNARRKGYSQLDSTEAAVFAIGKMQSIYRDWDSTRNEWLPYCGGCARHVINNWIRFSKRQKRRPVGKICSIDFEMEHEDYDIPDLDIRQPLEIVALREEFDRIMHVLNKKERKEAIKWANGVPAKDNAHVSLRYFTIRQKALQLLSAEDYVEYLYGIKRRASPQCGTGQQCMKPKRMEG